MYINRQLNFDFISSPAFDHSRLSVRQFVPVLQLALIACITYGLLQFAHEVFLGIESPLIHWLKSKCLWPVLGGIKYLVLRPEISGTILGLFILEYFFPAEPRQPIFSRGLAQDMIWTIITSAAQFTFVLAYLQVLIAIYQSHFGFITLPIADILPPFAFVIWWLLFMDLSTWGTHYLMHHIPWLWKFHRVHHSQTELNQFTAGRAHIAEYLIDYSIRILPLLVLGVNPRDMTYFFIVQRIFIHIHHANIRTNFGFFRFVLVSPQSHRLHHSRMQAHANKNFGTLFSFWDYLFGTQVRDYALYPQTGIQDKTFPNDKTANGKQLLLNPLWQLLSPFQIHKGAKR